ncbi:MAG: hypothetical protein IJ148_04280 [Bacteroidaceae bacterium]|nr:hypothetical protein [Bacteroidaceae bacterium]
MGQKGGQNRAILSAGHGGQTYLFFSIKKDRYDYECLFRDAQSDFITQPQNAFDYWNDSASQVDILPPEPEEWA